MITKIPFGRTGHMSTRTIFGAAALSNVTQEEADRTLDLLLQYDINHIDTAASYGDSELRIGPWMKKYRDHFFLATKTGARIYDTAREEFMRSLERLQVDSVDLIQLHYLVGRDEWEIAMGEGGVLGWVIEARDKGLTRFIGVTGHDVAIAERHLQSVDKFDFDSVLLPYNYPMMQNAEYVNNFEKLLSICEEKNIAVQTIKSITRRPWADRSKATHATWYEPLTEQSQIDLAVHWVLGREGIFLNTVGDITLLPKVLEAANHFHERPSESQMESLIARQDMKPLFE